MCPLIAQNLTFQVAIWLMTRVVTGPPRGGNLDKRKGKMDA